MNQNAVAVVGISCRVPGADDARAFWRLLRDGVDAIADVPADRRYPDVPELAQYSRGGFVDHVGDFDAGLFGVCPHEAAAMDPRQRFALELSWAALEDAGLPPESLGGTGTGVFLGATSDDYASLVGRHGTDAVSHHSLAGLSRGVIANRVSYQFGFHGPSLTVDTAQSSSLVAVHLACESLLSGACGLALAGGVHLNLVPESTLAFARAGALSPDCRSYTFDARANGFVRGEGAGVVVLKRLADAVGAGDRIYCVLLGGAVNHDGDGQALTVPDGDTQQALLREACDRAGVEPAQVQYVELHGTGTRAGDPVEAGALGSVLGAGREPGRPLLVGSVKTNIGHLDAASGVVGLIKVALALRHETVPASLNFAEPHPAIPLDQWNLRVNTSAAPWPESQGPRLAGVSSFGIGGTNCHLVVAAAPEPAAATADPGPTPDLVPVTVSGRSAAALSAQAGRLREWLEADPQLTPADVGHSALASRSALKYRGVVVAADRAELLAGLAALETGAPAPNVVTGTANAEVAEAGVVWVFPGQGSQWAGMARGLWAASPVFAAKMEECEQVLAGLVDWSLREVLDDEAALQRVEVLQPALFSVVVALSQVWRAAGLAPGAVVGHSQGEAAAACAAGFISLADGLRLSVERARAIGARLSGRGMMALLSLPAEEVDPDWGPIATYNGPRSVSVSGEIEKVRAVVAECAARGVRTGIIKIDYASHSAQVEQIRDEVLAAAADIATTDTGVAFYSTVEGRRVDVAGLDAEYWYRNLRQPVRFAQTVAALAEAGYGVFVEVSPHPVLTGPLQDTVPDAVVQGTLRRNDDEYRRLLLSAAELYTRGVAVDWRPFLAGGRRVELPTYAFQRQRYWVSGNPAERPAAQLPASGPQLAAVAPAVEPDGPALLSEQELWTLVRAQAAAVLGHADPALIESDSTFKELGFDSVTAVQLRDRINTGTGLRTPTSLLFDYPTPTALVAHLREQLSGSVAGRRDEATTAPAVADDDPIAVVGMSCRLPGGVASPEDLWRLVDGGVDAISPFPQDRGWPAEPGGYARAGGFLAGAGDFDAGFFRISPREALMMDPQQRQVLEVAWEALERAGQDPAELRRSRTGVFIGAMGQDYLPRLSDVPEDHSGHALTGSATSVVSGRLSYTLGLEGPAVSVDTACSSSLVALHLAVQSLRSGDCTMALAGGVTVMSTPGIFVEFTRQGGLSADGRCRAFADGPGGTGWAEGVGLLVLERLSDARRHGRRVLALVRGSAINHDGESNGLTAPNGPSQERVIRRALAAAGLAPAQVDAVEAHGTGTALGDPIEAQALLAAYGQDRAEPLWLGSVKSNIGHSQAAAGVTGVIKMIMAMRHGVLPRTLHADEPSHRVDWTSGAVRLLTEPRSWPQVDRPRRAGVSSFGISGTNAHVIIEQGDPEDAAPETGPQRPGTGAAEAAQAIVPWLVSARTAATLTAQAERLREAACAEQAAPANAIAWTLATGRSVFDHRAVVLGTNRADLLAGLAAVASGSRAAGVVAGRAATAPGIGVLFSGQGSQRLGMSRELAAAFPAFAAAWTAVCAEFAPYLEHSIDEVVGAQPDSELAALLDETAMTQPTLFAFEVAAFRLLESFGVAPSVLVGHSIGELAAAHVAGVFSLADAVRLVAARGRLMQALPRGGAMVAIEADEAEVLDALKGEAAQASIAAVNGPRAVVVSGAEEVVLDVEWMFSSAGHKTRRLRVSHAFHSPLMEPMLEEFAQVARSVSYAPARIPVVSNVTGALAEDGELQQPEYWVRHVRQAVRFADGVRAAVAAGAQVLVEAGPDGVLTAMAREVLADRAPDLAVLPLVRKGRSETRSVAEALAGLHVAGAAVDWRAYLTAAGIPEGRADLPTYAFDRQTYWVEPAKATGDVAGAGLDAVEHPFLAAAADLAGTVQRVFSGQISPARDTWLADHAIQGTPVFPGAAFVELALHAATDTRCRGVEELILQAPLTLAEGPVSVQIVVGAAEDSGRRELGIYSRAASADTRSWTRHATGFLSAEAGPAPGPDQAWPPHGATPIDLDDFYPRLAGRGYGYGPAFRGLRAAWRLDQEVCGEIALPDDVRHASGGFALHPAAFDAALHPMLLLLTGDDPTQVLLPYAWTGVTHHGGSSPRNVRVRVTPKGTNEVSLHISDADGAPVLSVASLMLLPASVGRPDGGAQADDLYTVAWTLLPQSSGAASTPPAVELTHISASTAGDIPASALTTTGEVLGRVHKWLEDEQPGQARRVLVTRGAVALAGEAPDLALAPVWGLIRSVQAEHPDRFVLVDTDGTEESARTLAALDVSREPQIAIRGGLAYVPRLTPVPAAAVALASGSGSGSASQARRPQWGEHGTVLLTGATGGLGALFARHLAADHGVRRLLLLSRTGAAAPGAADLAADLAALGTEVTWGACDVSDPVALAAQLAAIPADAPLTAVVHLAGVLDDAPAQLLTLHHLGQVFAPKVDAAWHLHQLTKDLDLEAFIMFSSISGTIGTAGQGNYSAANTFLDALAAHRRAAGLPATALAWGLWELGMAGTLSQTDVARFRRTGVAPLPADQGTKLFDTALALGVSALVPAVLDTTAFQQRQDVPAMFRELVGGAGAAGAGSGGSGGASEALREQAKLGAEAQLVQRLTDLSAEERSSELVALLLSITATVLDYASTDAIDPDLSFKEIGFDSLSGVEFRLVVKEETGVQLPATMIFNYPTPRALARHLQDLLFPQQELEAQPGMGAGEERDEFTEQLEEEIDALDVDDLILRALAE